MSTLPQPKPARPAEEQRVSSNHQVNVDLMRRMGSKSGYDPLPPAQHKWQGAKGEPELHRLWSWLVSHTVGWGHRTEYASDSNQNALYIESAAADLGMDEGNARACWREGLRRGLWRNGTPAEGKRRMYLNGELKPQDVGDSPDKKVCTDLPPYIWEQIKDWPEERRKECLTEYRRNTRVEKDLLAEVVAVGRSICAQQLHDTWVERWALKKITLDRQEKGSPEEIEARRARRKELTPILEGFVQTFSESVQSQESIVYELEKEGVQIENGVATLLPSEKARESQSGRASSSVNSPLPTQGQAPFHDGKKRNQLPAPQTPVLSASESETTAIDLFLTSYSILQLNYPQKFGGEKVSPLNKGDRAAALKIVRTIGPARTQDFLCYVEHRAVQNALGHRLRFGLVVEEWPGDFLRDQKEAERKRGIAAAAEASRRASADREREREARIERLLEEQWKTMADVGRDLRLIEAESSIKSDKEKRRIWQGMTADQKRQMVETFARATLRGEIRQREELKDQEGSL